MYFIFVSFLRQSPSSTYTLRWNMDFSYNFDGFLRLFYDFHVWNTKRWSSGLETTRISEFQFEKCWLLCWIFRSEKIGPSPRHPIPRNLICSQFRKQRVQDFLSHSCLEIELRTQWCCVILNQTMWVLWKKYCTP